MAQIMDPLVAGQDRWQSEAEFFDAEEYDLNPLPSQTVDRYVQCRRPSTPAEMPFASLGDLTNRRVFELGCGNGGNAILMALRGAKVVGVDISTRAIEAARHRAKLHGVEDRTEFFALPVEQYLERVDHKTFDVICGFGILHHLLPVLDEVMGHLVRLAHPETTYLFAEPIATSRVLRQVRMLLPIPIHATPDERPLEDRDLEVLRRHLSKLHLKPNGCLSRPWHRFIGGRVEDYSAAKLFAYHTLCWMDQLLLSLPGSLGLASGALLIQECKSGQR